MNEEQVNQHLPEITALTAQLKSDSMSLWSETKRKDFVAKFDERARVSRYIALKTAHLIREQALNKHFISSKHTNAMDAALNITDQINNNVRDRIVNPLADVWNQVRTLDSVGERPLSELDIIAKDRADQILTNLPPLKTAVAIINPEISKVIEERDKLLDHGKELFDQAKELSGELNMEDVDQEMTVSEFRKYIKDRVRKRQELLTQMNETGKDAQSLENRINKFLYFGLPGLSQAVVDVITDLCEKATALGTLNRRVGEKVMFGDSAAAVELLQSFEKDEVKVSDEVKAQFDKALEVLKLAGLKKAGKSLKKGK